MKTHSLETKLCVLIAGLFFALLLLIGRVQMNAEQNILVSERIERYQNLSAALGTAYEQLAETSDRSLYQGMTAKLMKADPDIGYVAIAGADKRVLFVDARHSSTSESASLEGKSIDTTVRLLSKTGNKRETEYTPVVMPALVGHGRHGTINIGLNKRSMNATIEELQSRFLAIFAVAFILAILGIIWLSKAVVSPVKELTSAVHSVMSGDLEVKVPVSSDDEIGELGAKFNQMVECLKDSHHKLVLKANTDSLTDLYNHRYFHERLTNEFSRAVRYRHPLSMIMIDIDHFKNLNDNFGHPFGDLVLQEVAKILVKESRDIDVVARYGGEEFAIILPETDIEDTMIVAERLRISIERNHFIAADDTEASVSISLGASQYPVHSAECEGLIMTADLAMYRSKSQGRNRATAFSSDMFSKTKESPQTADPYKLYLLLHADDISTIEAMAAAVDAKSQRYQGFSRSVMKHCVEVGALLGLSEKEKSTLKVASLLYDIGKLGLSESILSKPEKLSPEEQCIIQTHPALGYDIIQKSVSLKPILPTVLHHHEAWDGTGYPNGIQGNDIPLLSRVIAVVDAYHAMTNDRPFAKANSKDDAISELNRCSGTQFDPTIVMKFIQVLHEEDAAHHVKAA